MDQEMREWIVQGGFVDPHALLGLKQVGDRQVIILWRPDQGFIEGDNLEVKGERVPAFYLKEVGLRSKGFYEYFPKEPICPTEYRICLPGGKWIHDPYIIPPFISDLDAYLIAQGVHYQLYDLLGAHLRVWEGIRGVHFAVWAPNAKAVFVMGDFNHWDDRLCPLRAIYNIGVWEIFIPGVEAGEKYKFIIVTQTGEKQVKTDPYGYAMEKRPKTASIVCDVESFCWSDQEWIEKRSSFSLKEAPLYVYEVHLGSWQKGEEEFLSYRELSSRLIVYCHQMGFTHVELMGICEHPLDESWGYQVSGYFAPTSRYGTLEDFQFFVNELHRVGIGVILDWVPAHFPSDTHFLARFDGTALYEHEDTREGFHPHWNTYIFNYGRKEVTNFLIASALFWVSKMHIDGLRVDAVASMLYRDYGRKEGEWIPNCFGSNINLEAVEFLKHLNSIVHEKQPGVLMIAEESTLFQGLTETLEKGGLGFDLKWSLGWMHDTLSVLEKECCFRRYHMPQIGHLFEYAFSEKFILVLSHDEVVHGKRNLLAKMPGHDWDKFASLRLLLSFMVCMPGKKLLFMGMELGQWHEWDCKGEIAWNLLRYERHLALQNMVAEVVRLYKTHEGLYGKEQEKEGFSWVNYDDRNSVIAYLRKGNRQILLCVHHFDVNLLSHYELILPMEVDKLRLLFNSDREEWGGSGSIHELEQKEIRVCDRKITMDIPSLSTLVFQVDL